MSRLRQDTWWRLPPAKPPRARVHQNPSVFGWATPYWAGGLCLAALLQLEIIPFKQWVSPRDTSEAAVTQPAADAREAAETDSSTPPAEPQLVADSAAATALRWRSGAIEHGSSTTFQSIFGMRRRAAKRTALLVPPDASDVASAPESRRRRPDSHESAPRPKPRAKRASRTKPAPAPAPAQPTSRRRRSGGKAVSVSGGTSCSAAIAGYREQMTMGKSKVPADITAAKYGAVLNSGSYFSHCGVPDTTRIHICAAVQNGVAVGVTVTTQPGSSRVAGCIAGAVRGLSFPSHPRMDVTRTTFK